MTRPTRASLLATLFLPIIVVVAACGGASATPTPATGDTGTVTPPPAGGVTVTPDPNAGGPTGALPSFDLSALTGSIPGVDSYRSSFSTGGVVSYSTVVVTKPVLSKAITSFNDDGTVDTRYIVIDKDVWSADGADGAFTQVPGALGSALLLAFDPATLLSAYASIDFSSLAIGADQGVETKNGMQAHHLKIDGTTVPTLAAAFPAGAAINIWVADAGYLVAWEMSGFEASSDIAIEITGVNDPANKVDKPN
jgi:hypothetical protein